MTESSSFDLVSFIPLLRDRIYTANPFAKQFLVSWVSVVGHKSRASAFCSLISELNYRYLSSSKIVLVSILSTTLNNKKIHTEGAVLQTDINTVCICYRSNLFSG